MDFLKPEFEESLSITSNSDFSVSIGRFTYSSIEILKNSGDQAYDQVFKDWIREEWIPSRIERKNEILEFDSNYSRYQELKRIIENNNCIPFIGAGMSCPSGMPTWANFLKSLCDRATGITQVELEALLKQGDYEEAASRLLDSMPARLFDEQFNSKFSIYNSYNPQGPVRLLPLLFKSLVITTNFDQVIEKVYGSQDLQFQSILYGNAVGDFRRTVAVGERCLLKLHGRHDRISGRVLTREEYDRFYSEGASSREEVVHIFKTGGLIFLGCSLYQDRTMRLLEEIAERDHNMPNHFALLKLPLNGDKTLNNDEFVIREHFLAAKGIFPIWYGGNHDFDIEAILVGLLEDLGRF